MSDYVDTNGQQVWCHTKNVASYPWSAGASQTRLACHLAYSSFPLPPIPATTSTTATTTPTATTTTNGNSSSTRKSTSNSHTTATITTPTTTMTTTTTPTTTTAMTTTTTATPTWKKMGQVGKQAGRLLPLGPWGHTCTYLGHTLGAVGTTTSRNNILLQLAIRRCLHILSPTMIPDIRHTIVMHRARNDDTCSVLCWHSSLQAEPCKRDMPLQARSVCQTMFVELVGRPCRGLVGAV